MSRPQRDALIVIRAGLVPTLKPGPGRVAELPQPHDRIWRAAHGGKPIQAGTLRALEAAGHIERRQHHQPGSPRPILSWHPTE